MIILRWRMQTHPKCLLCDGRRQRILNDCLILNGSKVRLLYKSSLTLSCTICLKEYILTYLLTPLFMQTFIVTEHTLIPIHNPFGSLSDRVQTRYIHRKWLCCSSGANCLLWLTQGIASGSSSERWNGRIPHYCTSPRRCRAAKTIEITWLHQFSDAIKAVKVYISCDKMYSMCNQSCTSAPKKLFKDFYRMISNHVLCTQETSLWEYR